MANVLKFSGNFLIVFDDVTNEDYIRNIKSETTFQRTGDLFQFLYRQANIADQTKLFVLGGDYTKYLFSDLIDFRTGLPFNSAIELDDYLSEELGRSGQAITINGRHSELILDDGTNPHGTTKSDVGLDQVDNTSDADKPISTATQLALDTKLETVATDATLTGNGTPGSPLSVVGGGSGVQSVTGKIVDNTDPANPIVNENTYTEESTIIAGSNTGTWVVRSLGAAYANHDIEMKVYSSNGNQTFSCGVREVGSTVPKFFPIRIGTIHFEVRSDANGDIEILSGTNNNTFEVTGRKPVTGI